MFARQKQLAAMKGLVLRGEVRGILLSILVELEESCVTLISYRDTIQALKGCFVQKLINS